jgi:nicotinamide-nucleotide amidase
VSVEPIIVDQNETANELELEVQVGVWLRRRGVKLVSAESCTGGLVGHLLTNVPGSSDYFLGSVVAYANEAKERLLGVSHETLMKYGAVSREAVIEMASGARRIFFGTIPQDQLVGISISGIAGPGGAMPNKPVGLVWIGLSAPDMEQAYQYIWQGDRIENKSLSAKQALQILVDYLKRKVT